MSLLLEVRCFQMSLLEIFPRCSSCSWSLSWAGSEWQTQLIEKLEQDRDVRKCSSSMSGPVNTTEESLPVVTSSGSWAWTSLWNESLLIWSCRNTNSDTLIEIKITGLKTPWPLFLLIEGIFYLLKNQGSWLTSARCNWNLTEWEVVVGRF